MISKFLSFPWRRESSQRLVKLSSILLIAISLQACADKQPSDAEMQLLKSSRANMVFVQGGTFTMGQVIINGQLSQFYTPHQVTLSSYYISKDNVSYGEYDAYTQATGQPYIDNDFKQYKYFARAANYPVYDATWNQAHAYCTWLSKETGLPYDLPTEAQWEYAARNRGNPNWVFPTNNGKQDLGVNFPSFQQVTTQPGNKDGDLVPLPIGSIPCTPMGICGMGGEVSDWVSDWNQKDYNPQPVTNPQGPATGTQKVVRGGGVQSDSQYDNTINRAGADPAQPIGGFRCVINSTTPSSQLGAFASGYPK